MQWYTGSSQWGRLGSVAARRRRLAGGRGEWESWNFLRAKGRKWMEVGLAQPLRPGNLGFARHEAQNFFWKWRSNAVFALQTGNRWLLCEWGLKLVSCFLHQQWSTMDLGPLTIFLYSYKKEVISSKRTIKPHSISSHLSTSLNFNVP
jgi:hypothetical protein